MRFYLFIFQFLQKGTFLWLIHYQKYPISSKILSHKILEHNKRSLRVPRCSDNAIIVILILWTSSLLYRQQTSIVWRDLLISLFGPQFLQLQKSKFELESHYGVFQFYVSMISIALMLDFFPLPNQPPSLKRYYTALMWSALK